MGVSWTCAQEHEPDRELVYAIKEIRPTVLIRSSGAGQMFFNKELVEAMSFYNEKPVVLALSNPTLQSECTAEQAYTGSEIIYLHDPHLKIQMGHGAMRT